MIDPATFIDMLDSAALNGRCGEPFPYSGRAMFGKLCVAVSGDSASAWGLALSLASMAAYHGVDMYDLPEPDSDSLGRGIVLYWPRIAWPEDRPDPDRYDEDEED